MKFLAFFKGIDEFSLIFDLKICCKTILLNFCYYKSIYQILFLYGSEVRRTDNFFTRFFFTLTL